MSGKGYSCAPLRRFDVRYVSGGDAPECVSLVVKDATLVERRTQTHLYCQRHPCVPFCTTFDLLIDGRVPLCMEYIAATSANLDAQARERTAAAVAAIHARNLRDPGLAQWLPSADGAFIESNYVLGTFHTSWAQVLEDADFREE